MRDTLVRLRAQLEPLGVSPAEGVSLLVLLSGALALTAVLWWGNQPASTGPPGVGGHVVPIALTTAEPTTTPEDLATPGTLVVHVAGHVLHPGVVTVAAGARVGEAVQAAGGPTAEAVLDGLNLARVLTDGEQVRVPGPGETAGPADAAPGGPADPDAPLDLNVATVDQLLALPGVGPVTAERIISHRDAIGGFTAITQLLEVPGIGPARFADLESRVRL